MRLILFFLWLLLPASAFGHEFWVMPSTFIPPAGQPVSLRLYVGEFFRGDCVPFTGTFVRSLRHFSAGGTMEQPLGQPAPVCEAGMQVRPEKRGSLVFAIDTFPRQVVLPGEKFTDYLLAEGLDEVAAMRLSAGSADKPGRERYRRHIKTLLSVGGKSDATAMASTGQAIEIIPASPPDSWGSGQPAELRVLFDGKPLKGALLKAWPQRGTEPVTPATDRTDERGHVRFDVPAAGVWMFSVVHMVPATGVDEVDWDSFWGNLTVQVGRAAQAN